MGRRGALGHPQLPAGERGGGKRSRDAQLATVPLLGPSDWGNSSFFIEVLGTAGFRANGGTKTKDSPPGPPPGEGEVRSPSPNEQSPPSLGRPSQGLLHARLPPGLAGAWTGWASCLRPAPRRCLVEGCYGCVGARVAAGGAHGDEQADGLQPGWTQQVSSDAWCFWTPQSASVLLRTAGQSSRQRRRRGRSMTWEHSGTVPSPAPSCQRDTARDGAPGLLAWTSHDPETVQVTFVARSVRSVATRS